MKPLFKMSTGSFRAMLIHSAEEDMASLRGSWATPEQQEFNASHKTCPRCHGRGQIRRDERMACRECLGTGSVL